MNTYKFKQAFYAILLVAFGAVSTFAYLTIDHLKKDNDRLEDQKIQMEVRVQELQGQVMELEAEGERLK